MAIDDTNGFGLVKKPRGATRIRYIEPNDIYGEINGVPTTPDYTDYCIWCKLTVEKYSRIKNGSHGKSETSVYNYYWDATKADGINQLSFMRGRQDGPGYNYLTTDYTEIDFNEVKDRNFIEGLGIESVSIAMNNYYVPEITINFVDVRGSGFFSREEATHDTFDLINLEKDQYGNMVDNFYSCFVSFPYPRFRLQVKGFYGRPVTYQLTCSSFTGSLDSSTGNFKLTAKFIGYFYGIMTDIPYEYLVAAPLCKYEGEEYWAKQVETNDNWKLDDGRSPIKLFDFYNKVSDAMQTEEGRANLMGTMSNDTLENYKAMLKSLNQVKIQAEELKSEISKSFNNIRFECNTENSDQLLLAAKADKVKVTDRVCTRYNALVSLLDDYAREYGSAYKTENGETLDRSKRPGIQEDRWASGNASLVEFFTIIGGKLYCEGKCLDDSSASFGELSLPTYSPSNGNGSNTTVLSEDMIGKLKKNSTMRERVISEKAVYACAIDFNRIETAVKKIETKVKIEIEKLENELSDRQTQRIIDYFGFAPYVGNFFKLVMCHLETFVAIMYKVADIIDGQIENHDREPQKLGVNDVVKETDIPKPLNFIPPWPAIYKDKPTRQEGDSEYDEQAAKYETFGDETDTRGWVGDALGKVEWEEKKMLMQFYDALMVATNPKTADGTDLSASEPSIQDVTFPSLPSDLSTGIPSYEARSREELAAYLGIRLMQIYALYNRGELNEKYATAFAILDAYNIACQEDNEQLKSHLISSNGGDIGDELYDLMLAKETGNDNSLSYEFAKIVDGRHPIFVEDGPNLVYRYMRTKNGIPILPVRCNELTQGEIKKSFTRDKDRFVPIYNPQGKYSQLGNGFQYPGSTANLLNNYTEEERMSIKAEYENASLFHIVTDKDVEKLTKYDEMFNTDELSSGSDWLDDILKKNRNLFRSFSSKYWKTMKTNEYLQDNSVDTEVNFNKNSLKDITAKNIKTKIGRRKPGY